MTMRIPARLLAVSALSLLSVTTARAEDVSLDNVEMKVKDGGTLLIRHVDVLGTNLTKAEVAKLFNVATPKEEGQQIVAKMKASRIAIPEARIVDKDASGTMRDLQMKDVDSGKVGNASVATMEIAVTSGDSAPINAKLGPVMVEGADFTKLLEAAASGDASKAFEGGQWARVGKMDLRNLDVTATDKDVEKTAPGGNSFHVTMASMTGAAAYVAGVPTKQSFELKNVVVTPPPSSDMGKQLASVGYDKVDIGMTAAATYDPAKKTLAFDDFTLNGAGMGSFGMKGNFGNIDPSFFTGDQTARMQQMLGGNVSNLEIKLVNAGLFEKAAAFYAKQQGKTVDALKKELGNGANMMAPVLLQGDPIGVKLAEAVNKFLAKPGTFRIAAKAKKAPLGAADFLTVTGPQDILPKLDITVSAE